MKVSFLLHLYQPSFQTESVFREIYNKSYFPLVKLLKTHKTFKITLNIPLSLLEMMDKYGCSSWITDIKDLINQEQVEITGSGAYHPILTKIPLEIAEKEIILNEYGLGYYFGRRSGFEGEPSVLIKDLNGFFPPELALNSSILNLVDSMGYKWCFADQTALPLNANNSNNVYDVKDLNIKLVVRDDGVSNMLAFKRDLNTDDVFSALKSLNKEHVILALDGETFGHHFKDGIVWLETFVTQFSSHNLEALCLTDLVDEIDEQLIDSIVESTWGASKEEIEQGNIYPMWDSKENKVHQALWEFLHEFSALAPKQVEVAGDGISMESIPVWKLTNETNPTLLSSEQNVAFLKLFNSDQFWWVSNAILPSGQKLYDRGIILGILNDYREYLSKYSADSANESLNKKLTDLENLI